jgi:prepilin-type N-terminal cleavage/methylation domain-containing protein
MGIRQNRRERHGEKGFSLVEMLAASLLLATVLLAVGMIYPRAMSAIKSSGDRAKASNLAQKKIEELFQAASCGDVGHKLREGTYEDRPDPGFTRTWSITRDRMERSVADLCVTVAWKRLDRERSVTLRTLVALKEGDT